MLSISYSGDPVGPDAPVSPVGGRAACPRAVSFFLLLREYIRR